MKNNTNFRENLSAMQNRNVEALNLKSKYEKGILKDKDLSLKQVDLLLSLYIKQIADIDKIIRYKK